jgi:hypothetical protein
MNITTETLNKYILDEVRPRLKNSPQLQEVIAWAKGFNKSTGILYLGMALGNSTGCSPFCGCAAREIAEVIGEEIKKDFPEIKSAVGMAEYPPEGFIEKWNEDLFVEKTLSDSDKV